MLVDLLKRALPGYGIWVASKESASDSVKLYENRAPSKYSALVKEYLKATLIIEYEYYRVIPYMITPFHIPGTETLSSDDDIRATVNAFVDHNFTVVDASAEEKPMFSIVATQEKSIPSTGRLLKHIIVVNPKESPERLCELVNKEIFYILNQSHKKNEARKGIASAVAAIGLWGIGCPLAGILFGTMIADHMMGQYCFHRANRKAAEFARKHLTSSKT